MYGAILSPLLNIYTFLKKNILMVALAFIVYILLDQSLPSNNIILLHVQCKDLITVSFSHPLCYHCHICYLYKNDDKHTFCYYICFHHLPFKAIKNKEEVNILSEYFTSIFCTLHYFYRFKFLSGVIFLLPKKFL